MNPLTRSLASTSRQAPLRRLLSSSASPLAASTAHLPKRDPTTYGLPRDQVDKKDWPLEKDVDTSKHPLWRFFHNRESLEVPDKRVDNSGRSWAASELRRKSFTELHELWYILVRERNVLLSQREEARRLRVDLRGFSGQADKLRIVQKSMARTKQVLSERRHAALEAAAILRARGEDEAAARMAKEGEEFSEELAGTRI